MIKLAVAYQFGKIVNTLLILGVHYCYILTDQVLPLDSNFGFSFPVGKLAVANHQYQVV